jgi:anti-sigma B factor antagonist
VSAPNLLTVQASLRAPGGQTAAGGGPADGALPGGGAMTDLSVIEVVGELDVYSAPQLRDVLLEATSRPAPLVIVDLSGLRFMDSSGLGVLVAGWKRARDRGGRLGVAALPTRVARVFRTTGLDRALPVFATVAAAEAELLAVAPRV